MILDGFNYDADGDFSGLPVIGNIRKGGEKTDNGRVGPDLDHFRVTMKEGYEDYLPDFHAIFGETPEVLNGLMLTGGETMLEVFPHSMQEFAGNGDLVKECDTQVNTWLVTGKDRMVDKRPKPCMRHTTGCACQPTGYLRVFIPEFSHNTGVWGLFQITVKSGIEINRIRQYLQGWQKFLKLNAVPFCYNRAPEAMHATTDKGRVRVTKSLCTLTIMPEAMRLISEELMSRPLSLKDVLRDQPLSAENTVPQMIASTEATNALPSLSAGSYDFEALREATKHLFKAPQHQQNAINQAVRVGALLPTMDTETAIQSFKDWRVWRDTANTRDAVWNDDPEMIAGLFTGALDYFGLNQVEVIRALERDINYTLTGGVPLYPGSKNEAWVAVLAAAIDYDETRIQNGAISSYTMSAPQITAVIQLCQRVKQPQS